MGRCIIFSASSSLHVSDTQLTVRAAAPDIVLDQVTFHFGEVTVLENFSLRLAGGATTCLLGPSGCGKSTILRCLSGALPLADGRIYSQPEQPLSAQVAWMGQQDLLLPWLNLLDNILLGARLRGENLAAKKDTALSLLTAAGLEKQASCFPAALSGGMRQRGALLRTLMEERPVILMDEPFSALDALSRLRLQNLAAELTANATVVLVTHDPLEALRLANRIVVLGGGHPTRIVASLDLAATPPRPAGDPESSGRYPELLAMLLQEPA